MRTFRGLERLLTFGDAVVAIATLVFMGSTISLLLSQIGATL